VRFAIGPATARALTERGVTVAFVPEEYVAERSPQAWATCAVSAFIAARGDARKTPEELTTRGVVDEIAAYATRLADPDPRCRCAARRSRRGDVHQFVDGALLRRQFGREGQRRRGRVHRPITAQTARDLACSRHAGHGIYRRRPVRALEDYFDRREKPV
jgi:hypothetical protein